MRQASLKDVKRAGSWAILFDPQHQELAKEQLMREVMEFPQGAMDASDVGHVARLVGSQRSYLSDGSLLSPIPFHLICLPSRQSLILLRPSRSSNSACTK